MAKFSLLAGNDDSTNNVSTVVLDFEPFNSDVEIDVVPKTRSLILKAINNAKKNPKSRRRVHRDPDNPKKKIVIDADENAAFMDELADLLIVDWRGVEEAPGVPADCTRENKILLFDNIKVSGYLLEVSESLAGTADEEDEGKSLTS